MQEKDADNRIYKCDDGEEVTVTLKPKHPTKFGATYSFDNDSAKPVANNKVTFKMTGNILELTMTFSFFSASGKCKVELDGAGNSHFEDPNNYVNIGLPLINHWKFEK